MTTPSPLLPHVLPVLLTAFSNQIRGLFCPSLRGKITSPTFLWSGHKVSPADSCHSHLSRDTVTVSHRGMCVFELCGGGQWSYVFCEGETYWNHNICTLSGSSTCFVWSLIAHTHTHTCWSGAQHFCLNTTFLPHKWKKDHANIQIFFFGGFTTLLKGTSAMLWGYSGALYYHNIIQDLSTPGLEPTTLFTAPITLQTELPTTNIQFKSQTFM